MAATPQRRWYQYTLQGILIVMTLTGFGLGWLAYERHKVQKREAAIAAIEKLGGIIKFDLTQPFRPNWLRPVLGVKSSGEVVEIYISISKVTDADLAYVSEFTKLRRLSLQYTQVTDAGLVHIAGLKNLKRLDLDDTKVTDVGLAHLYGLTSLERLSLSRTQVTDQGVSDYWKAFPKVYIGR